MAKPLAPKEVVTVQGSRGRIRGGCGEELMDKGEMF